MVPVPVPEFPDVTWIQNWFDCADHEQLLPVTVTVDSPELPAAGDVMVADYFGRGGSTTVEVPVDDRLEKKALTYIGSAERWQRTEGARALQHFKSDENIARVHLMPAR